MNYLDFGFNNGEDGNVVASLLGDLLAVVVAITVTISVGSGLAHSNHLGLALLLEANLKKITIVSLVKDQCIDKYFLVPNSPQL